MVSLDHTREVNVVSTYEISDEKLDINTHLTLNRANMFLNDWLPINFYFWFSLWYGKSFQCISIWDILTYPWRFTDKSVGFLDSNHHRNTPFAALPIFLPLYCSLLHLLTSDILNILRVCLFVFCPSHLNVSSLKTRVFVGVCYVHCCNPSTYNRYLLKDHFLK